jgi:predicted acylesterase/phospholipase RssA
VLGGGGFTGGVYEIGALRALDLLSVNRTSTTSTSSSGRAPARSSPR